MTTLRFLRQLKQGLLAERRFSKYLLYAGGEIVLVVIGILIALQINNWNETQKNRSREREYLEGLQSEMQRNLIQSEFQIGVNYRQLSNGQFILGVIDGDTLVENSAPLALARQGINFSGPLTHTPFWDFPEA